MIANIFKGTGFNVLVRYCLSEGRGKKLEPGREPRAEVLGGQNFRYEVRDRETAYRAAEDMEDLTLAREDQGPPYRSGRPLKHDRHHLILSWARHEQPDNEHMAMTARDALKKLGMERALSVFIRHRDQPHPHMHVVSSRIDPETGRVFSDSWDRHRAEAWSIEYEHAHELVRPSLQRRLERAHEMTKSLEMKRLEIGRQLDLAEERMAKLEHDPASRGMSFNPIGNPLAGAINRWADPGEVQHQRQHELEPAEKAALKSHQRELGRGREMDIFGFDDGSSHGQSGHGGD